MAKAVSQPLATLLNGGSWAATASQWLIGQLGQVRASGRPLAGRTFGSRQPADVDCIVIGAGVVGCAISRALALSGVEVIMLDTHRQLGFETSSRNSEVIHAGIYYPPGSLKARLCVEGKHKLYDFCRETNVPHKQIGKLIVATNGREAEKLEGIRARAESNGVTDLKLMTAKESQAMEPALQCTAALFSPSTGIIDSHSFMVALRAQMEEAGGTFVGNYRVVGGEVVCAPGSNSLVASADASFTVQVEHTGTCERSELRSRMLVNSGGLHAQEVSSSIQGLPAESIPPRHLARGCYFTTSSLRVPFTHLIYPVPVDGGLGVHLTLDLSGSARFGPDVEWVDTIDYAVDPSRAESFYDAIRSYYPALPSGCLVPDYAGIRPKVTRPGEPAGDFIISGPPEHGVPRMVNLYGIESPGLTASMAIADEVVQLLI